MAESVDDVTLLSDGQAGKTHPGASMAGCVLNLANTIMGTGILALPYALKGTGLVPGGCFLILAAGTGMLSLHFLSESARQVGRPANFYSVSEAAYPGLSVAVDMVVVVNGFLACLGFLIVAGDAFTDLHGPTEGGPNRQVWTLIAIAIVTPLTMLKRLDMLKFTSALSMIVLLLISGIVILFSLRLDVPDLTPCALGVPDSQCAGPVDAFTAPISTVRSFATFVVSFTCQQNLFAVTNELRNPTPTRCLLLIVLSISLAAVLYAAVGYAGYLTFGNRVLSDIIATYPEGNPIVTVARAGIALVVLTCYPLQAFAVRTSLGTLLTAAYGACITPAAIEDTAHTDITIDSPALEDPSLNTVGSGRESSGPLGPPPVLDEVRACGPLGGVFVVESRAIGVIALLLGSNTALAMVVTKLGIILDINGSLSGTAITFIVPGVVFYLLRTPDERKGGMGKSALVMAIVGTLLVPVSLTAAFLPSSIGSNVTA